MYATITSDAPVGGSPVLARRLTAGREPLTVAVWATQDEARAAADGGTVWTVEDHTKGLSADEPPAATQVTWFHGPRSDAHVAAARRGGRERLWPALHDLEGLVDVLVLVAPDGGSVVFGSATSADVFEEVQRRVMSTTLLPGEDPALLTGPDRIETYAAETLVAGAG